MTPIEAIDIAIEELTPSVFDPRINDAVAVLREMRIAAAEREESCLTRAPRAARRTTIARHVEHVARRGLVHTYTLDDGTTIVMCAEHRDLIRGRVTSDDGHEPGGKWKCAVCTVHRRITGGIADPKSAVVGRYIITRYPDGVIYCTCPAWLFQRVPPANRTCKHIDIGRSQLR